MVKISLFTLVYFVAFCSAYLLPSTVLAEQLNWMGHWKGEYGRQQLVEEVKKEFEFMHPDVDVNLIYDVDLDAPGDYFKKKVANTIVEMIRTGEIKWDIIFLGVTVYNYVAEALGDPYWGRKYLLDYSTVPGFRESHKSFIINTPYYRDQTGGIFVGPFIEGLITCLWYNKKVAGQLQLEIPQQGMTIEQFIGYAEKLAEYNAAAEKKIPLLSLSTYYRIEALFEFLFKSQFDDPLSVVELSYSDEKAKAFLDTLLIFEKIAQYQPVLNEGWRKMPVFPWMQDYLAGNQGLFAVGGTYWYGHFKGHAPEVVENGVPVEPPIVHHANGLVGQYSNVWAIMKDSPHRETAIDLLQLWSEPKVAEKWIKYTKNPTGLRGHLGAIESSGDLLDIYSDFVNKMSRKYEGLPMRNYRSPVYVFGKDCKVSGSSFRENLALILEGKQTARQYFTVVMTLHNRVLGK